MRDLFRSHTHLKVISSRFPIGVATTYRAHGSGADGIEQAATKRVCLLGTGARSDTCRGTQVGIHACRNKETLRCECKP